MTDLKKYNEKRDFSSTKEPKGKVSEENLLRFVIQFHQARRKHFDFRLEHNGVLLSWAVPKGLSSNPKDKRLAVMVEDHPVSYIDFEGQIPEGNYGAGMVEVYDTGTYEPVFPVEKGLKKGHLKFILNGKKFKGMWSLVKTDEKNWLIFKHEDEYAGKEISVQNPFSNCDVMLAKLAVKIPTGKDWSFEIKYDGYRAVTYMQEKTAKILSRNGVDITNKFKEISKSIENIKCDEFVVDGEIVCFDENGRTDFSLLQSNIKSGNTKNACYVVFDILSQNGVDLRDLPLEERRQKLKNLLSNNVSRNIIFSEGIDGNGEKCFEFAKKNNLEGIIAKNKKSKYLPKRDENWLKIKCQKIDRFVCVGYTKTKSSDFKSILLAKPEGDKLVYMGRVGTGFGEIKKRNLLTIFSKNVAKKPEKFENFDEKISDEVVWLKPKIFVFVKYTEITNFGHLRHPSFLKICDDTKSGEE